MIRSLNFRYHPNPVGTIEMHTIEGYGDYIGYAINAKGEVYTAKNRDEEGHWMLMKLDRDKWRFNIKNKFYRLSTEEIKDLYSCSTS